VHEHLRKHVVALDAVYVVAIPSHLWPAASSALDLAGGDYMVLAGPDPRATWFGISTVAPGGSVLRRTPESGVEGWLELLNLVARFGVERRHVSERWSALMALD
jgi:hypothetical protein